MANQKRGRQSFILSHPPAITHWASVAGKKESEGPLGPYLRHQISGYLFRAENMGTGRKTDAEAGSREAGGKGKHEAGGLRPCFLRRPSEPVYRLVLHPSQSGNSPPWAVRRVFHHGGKSCCCPAMAVGGGFTDNAVAMTSSHFASCRAAVPLSSGLRRAADADRRNGRLPAAGCCTGAQWRHMAPASRAATVGTRQSTSASRTPTTWARPWLPPPIDTIRAAL